MESTSLEQFEQMEENNAARYEATVENFCTMQTSLKTVLSELKAENNMQYQAFSQAVENACTSIISMLSDMEAGNVECDTQLNQRLADMTGDCIIIQPKAEPHESALPVA